MGTHSPPTQTVHAAHLSGGCGSEPSPFAAQMCQGVSPVPVQMWQGVIPVPEQLWQN